MAKELAGICIAFLFCATGMMHGETTAMHNDGQLDQQQTNFDNGLACLGNDEFAQGFVPTMDILTKVELLMTRNQTAVSGLQISIREEPTGSNLATVNISEENVTAQSYEWVTVDFGDIYVTPGKTYYIIWDGWHGGTAEKTYYWGFGSEDPYPYAHSYYYDSLKDEWHLFDTLYHGKDIDFCFKTYGQNNQPPAAPQIPAGDSYLQPGVDYSFATKTTDPEENMVKYCFDWDDGSTCNWTSLHPSGEKVTVSHTFFAPGNHDIRAKATDEYGKESPWSDAYRVFVEDQPPDSPSITGPASGKAGTSLAYNFSATDPNREKIRFLINWGDGSENVTGYYDSGETVRMSHLWKEQGSYTISAKAENNKSSDWTYLQVSMPKSFDRTPHMLQNLPTLWHLIENLLSAYRNSPARLVYL